MLKEGRNGIELVNSTNIRAKREEISQSINLSDLVDMFYH